MMLKIFLFIILVEYRIAFSYNVVITRQVSADAFTPLRHCAQECVKRNGACGLPQEKCCQECTCDRGKTFFEDNGYQKCIRNVGHKESKYDITFCCCWWICMLRG